MAQSMENKSPNQPLQYALQALQIDSSNANRVVGNTVNTTGSLTASVALNPQLIPGNQQIRVPNLCETPLQVSYSTIMFLNREIIVYSLARCGYNLLETLDFIESNIGFSMGTQCIERLLLSSSKEANALFVNDQRESIKFICKDLWWMLFNKQADRLQTNKKGGYVIQDYQNPWLKRLSSSQNKVATEVTPVQLFANESLQSSPNLQQLLNSPDLYISLISGILRGALAAFGMKCSIRADFATLPACSFQVRISSSSS